MPQSAVARKISVWYTENNKSQGDAENKRQAELVSTHFCGL